MDLFVTLTIVLSFAALSTAHVALVAGLVARKQWWRAPFALVVVPLAPYWGFRERMRARVVVWTAALAVYLIMLVIGRTIGG
jgi:hypothetical protein